MNSTDNVTALKPKKAKPKRTHVRVCWGGMGLHDFSDHIAVAGRGTNGCTIESDTGLLVIDEGEDKMVCYPIGSVFFWTEKPEEESAQ